VEIFRPAKGWQASRATFPTDTKPRFLHAALVAHILDNHTRPQLLLLSNKIAPVLVVDPTQKQTEGYRLETRGHLGARDACAADMDGDGRLDVVAAYKFLDAVLWYKNFGNGTFGPPQEVCPRKRTAPSDERSDASRRPGCARKALCPGAAATPLGDAGTCRYACGLACQDFDGDGRVDVAVVAKEEPHLSVFFQRGAGFVRVDEPFAANNTRACAVAAFSRGLNGSAATLAYAARGEAASFGIVTVASPPF